jgi:hypothetical protein
MLVLAQTVVLPPTDWPVESHPHRHPCAVGVVVLAHGGAFLLVVVAHVDGRHAAEGGLDPVAVAVIDEGGAGRATHARQAVLDVGRWDGASLSHGRGPIAQRAGPRSRRTNTRSAKASNDLRAPATPVVQPATAIRPPLRCISPNSEPRFSAISGFSPSVIPYAPRSLLVKVSGFTLFNPTYLAPVVQPATAIGPRPRRVSLNSEPRFSVISGLSPSVIPCALRSLPVEVSGFTLFNPTYLATTGPWAGSRPG